MSVRTIVVILGLSCARIAAAQEAPPVEKSQKSEAANSQTQKMEQAQKRFAEIQTRLKLTPDQMEKVRPLIVDEMQKLKVVRDDLKESTGRKRDRMQAGRKMRSIENETEGKLKQILSKEQMAEYKKIREERREQFRERAAAKR